MNKQWTDKQGQKLSLLRGDRDPEGVYHLVVTSDVAEPAEMLVTQRPCGGYAAEGFLPLVSPEAAAEKYSAFLHAHYRLVVEQWTNIIA